MAVSTDCFQEDEEAGVGSGGRLGSGGVRRRMLRRNSVSMILENPVLAQVRAAEGCGAGFLILRSRERSAGAHAC